MKIINHPDCTHPLGAPSDMQDGSCDALPVMYQTTEHGQFAVSFWQPDPDDLAELLAGGGINLWVRAPGRQHPVVALGTFPAPPADEKNVLFIENARLLGVNPAILCQMRIELRTMIDEALRLRHELANTKACLHARNQVKEGLEAENAKLRAHLEIDPQIAGRWRERFAEVLAGAGPMENRNATLESLMEVINHVG